MTKLLNLLVSLVFGIISTATVLNAQIIDNTREVESFDKIFLSGSFDVELRRSSFRDVKVTMEESLYNYVQIYVENRELKVFIEEKKMTSDAKKLFRNRKEGDYKIVITTPETIRSLTLSGKINLTRLENALINEESMLFTINDESSMYADLEWEHKNISLIMSKKSSAELSIQAVENFSLDMSGNSTAKIQLNSKVSNVVMSSNANCVFNLKGEALSVNSKGTAKLIFNGSVVDTKYQISGSGDVNAENLPCESAEVVMSGHCTLTLAARSRLSLDIKNGAQLAFKNTPAITITSIKNSTVLRYGDGF